MCHERTEAAMRCRRGIACQIARRNWLRRRRHTLTAAARGTMKLEHLVFELHGGARNRPGE
jgi:hypothetical protein